MSIHAAVVAEDHAVQAFLQRLDLLHRSRMRLLHRLQNSRVARLRLPVFSIDAVIWPLQPKPQAARNRRPAPGQYRLQPIQTHASGCTPDSMKPYHCVLSAAGMQRPMLLHQWVRWSRAMDGDLKTGSYWQFKAKLRCRNGRPLADGPSFAATLQLPV